MINTFEEMQEDESICAYCWQTEYGECAFSSTPNGYYFCEGRYCKQAYNAYLDEKGLTENVVKYAGKVRRIK